MGDILSDEEIKRARSLCEAATPGPWYDDSQDCEDGHGKFHSYTAFDAEGRSLFGTENSTASEIYTDHNEDGSFSWDHVGRVNIDFACRARTLIPRLLATIEADRKELDRIGMLLGECQVGYATMEKEFAARTTPIEITDEMVERLAQALEGCAFPLARKHPASLDMARRALGFALWRQDSER